jgi:hypothetical protein
VPRKLAARVEAATASEPEDQKPLCTTLVAKHFCMKYSAVSAYCDIKKIAKAAPRIRNTTNTLRKTIALPPKHPIFERNRGRESRRPEPPQPGEKAPG